MCYSLAFFYPKPLDYLVHAAHFFFFGVYQKPDINGFVKFEEPAIGEVYDSEGKIIIKLAKEYRRINQYSDFPPIIVGAVLATEDKKFFKHNGIDYWTFLTSVVWDTAGSTWMATSKHRPYFNLTVVMPRGGSTLTQQAVRLYFLSEIIKIEKSEELFVKNWRTRLLSGLWFLKTKQVNTILRKIQELSDSIYIEKEFIRIYGSKQKAKEEIFTRYANIIYLGSVYGLGYGAEYYFGKSVNSFTKNDAHRAAMLAGMIKYPLPRVLTQESKITEKYIIRKNAVLRLMAINNYISHKEAVEFIQKKVEFTSIDRKKTDAPSVIRDVFKELNSYGFSSDDLFTGFINIKSTIDLRIQEIANSALENGLTEYEKRHPEYKDQTQGSFVILAYDGRVLAIGGGRKFYKGREYRYSDLNRVNRPRQIGSTFKPLVYLTAYMNGWRPEDIIFDAPFSISMGYGRGRHHIRNYDGKYKGSIELQDALKGSRNVPTVKLAIALSDGKKKGMEKIAETVKLLGIKSELHNDIDHKKKRVYYPTSALGASEMNLMEIANAYREIAAGTSIEPYMINKIIGRNGVVKFIKSRELASSQISPFYLEMIRSSLRRVVSQPGGTAYSLTSSNFPIPIAGKTGTTDDFRNAWFIGFSSGKNAIVVGTAINFDDNRSLGKSETGSKTALPIVKEIFQKVYEKNLAGPAEPFSNN